MLLNKDNKILYIACTFLDVLKCIFEIGIVERLIVGYDTDFVMEVG